VFSRAYNLLKDHRVLAATLVVTLLVYIRFLSFGHISWDDPEMVFKNKAVREFDLHAFFTQHYVGNYIPLTMLAHSLIWQLFGSSDWAHHLLNILLHLANGILVYSIGRRLLKQELIALSGAVIFLLHPLQAESVGWIGELKNVLSATFYLAGMLSYVRFTEKQNRKDYALAFLFFVLGCLSKSSVVVLPLSLLCVDVIRNREIRASFITNKIPFLILSLVFGYINIQTQSADLFINHSHEFPFYQRVALAGFALIKYLLLFLLPFNLSVIYPYPALKPTVLITGMIVLLLLIAALFILMRRKKYTSIALICFILFNLILVLQLLPFGEVLYADRYLYIPVIGLAWILGLILSKLKLPQLAVSAGLIVVLAVLTFVGISRWKNAITLYEDILKKYPDLFIALNSAGVESMMLNEDGKALSYLNRAVEVAPRNYKGYYNRGLLYLKDQKPEQAIKSFNETIDLYPYNKAYVGRASAYQMLGDLSKAMNDANKVLSTEPDNANAHFILGNCYNDMNRLSEAMREYNTCIELNTEDPDYYFKRAIVWGKQQNFRACLGDMDICLSLDPNHYEAYYWKGVAKVNLSQNPCEDFRTAAMHNHEQAAAAFNKYCR